MQPRIESLPKHDELGPWTRALEVICLVVAAGLLLFHLLRFFTTPDFFSWWIPLAILAGFLLADFASGIIHWIADTWGSESMPVLGRRFLRPFRVHHVNPDDFLQRNFIDTNGDVAMMCIPFLLIVFLIPLDNDVGRAAAAFLIAYCACALPTNQVHQWAHMSKPPLLVRWLQQCGFLLSREQHQLHHTSPFDRNYCISTGWCNRVLSAVRFFPAMEWLISSLTGAKPRSEDLVYAGELDRQPATSERIN